MSKVTALSHITSLAMTPDNIQASIGDLYDDTVKLAGRLGFLGTASAIQSVATTRRYASPADTTQLLGVFYDDTYLPEHTLLDLENVSADWRADTDATPLAASFDTEVPNTFTLYPDPVAGSNAPSGTFATAFGSGFEANQLSVLHTHHPTDIDSWLEPFVMFLVLRLEFQRESHHQDPTTADAAEKLSQLMLTLVS
jgi:hypothetical protein